MCRFLNIFKISEKKPFQVLVRLVGRTLKTTEVTQILSKISTRFWNRSKIFLFVIKSFALGNGAEGSFHFDVSGGGGGCLLWFLIRSNLVKMIK